MEKRAKVAIIQSNKENASEIEFEDIRIMVREAVELAGGLDFIKDGQTVVVKPNLVGTKAVTSMIEKIKHKVLGKSAIDNIPTKINGMTVDFRVTKAFLEILRETNPNGKILIMECSGSGEVKRIYEKLGYTKENMPEVDEFIGLDKTGEYYRNINSPELSKINLANKQKYQNLPKFLNNYYYYDKRYYEADHIISICCLKNHKYAGISGGIKNVAIGAMPGLIYGNKENDINRVKTINHNMQSLSQFIHDYYIGKPVSFVLTDGLQGLSNGPQGSTAQCYDDIKMNMRTIMASKNAVAIDYVHSCIVGIDPAKIPYLNYIAKALHCSIDVKDIEIVGNRFPAEIKKKFPIANGLYKIKYISAIKTQYDDYCDPFFKIDIIKKTNNLLEIETTIEDKVKVIELRHKNDVIAISTNNKIISNIEGYGMSELKLYAYDRLLNTTSIDLKL